MLTQRQLQLLRFIHAYVAENGVPPSFEEMRAALRLRSKSGIHRLISGLEERGYIRRLAYRARAIEILKPPLEMTTGKPPARSISQDGNVVRGLFEGRVPLAGVRGSSQLPLYGRIAAGTPIEALADTSTVIEVPEMFLGDGEHYVLQVVGDSMREAGILDGDYVVIRRCETAESGDIVVALIEDREVTLKRLRRRGASIALEAANPAYETRIFGPHQVKIQGRLVGLLRRY
ncbi:LexA repressor [bacterium HR40]|nr:LexA repressor [bacterium HR40]